MANIEERIDVILDSIGSMKEDEIRARQQLEEIKLILKDSKYKIREYNLPIIPKNYFVELDEAQVAIKEIIKELGKFKELNFKKVKVIKMSAYYSVFIQVEAQENLTIKKYLSIERKVKSNLKTKNKLIRFIDIEPV